MPKEKRQVQPIKTDKNPIRGYDDFELSLGDVMRGERATLGKSFIDVQRELRIKADIICAIEECDISAFHTPGFIAGNVRSYATYLGLDPDWAYKEFCAATGHTSLHERKSNSGFLSSSGRPSLIDERPRFIDDLINPQIGLRPAGDAFLSRIDPEAVRAGLGLMALIAVLGYGAWYILAQIQKVNIEAVNPVPTILADGGEGLDSENALNSKNFLQTTPENERLTRLYQPDLLEVPVFVSRDTPMAFLDPNAIPSSSASDANMQKAKSKMTYTIATSIPPGITPSQSKENITAVSSEPVAPQLSVAQAPEVTVVAVRPSWIQVVTAEGDQLVEKIMKPGEVYAPPALDPPPLLKVGESGAVYFIVGNINLGPVGKPGQVSSGIVLAAEKLQAQFAIADMALDPDLEVAIADARAQFLSSSKLPSQ